VQTLADKGEGGSSNADVRIFGAKKFGFFEIYGVSAAARRREVDPVRTRSRGSIFRDFVRTLCNGRPLMKYFPDTIVLICLLPIMSNSVAVCIFH